MTGETSEGLDRRVTSLYRIFIAFLHLVTAWEAGQHISKDSETPSLHPHPHALSHLLSSYLSGFKSGLNLHPSHGWYIGQTIYTASCLPIMSATCTYMCRGQWWIFRIWPPCCWLLSYDRSSLSPVTWDRGRGRRNRFPPFPLSTSRIQTPSSLRFCLPHIFQCQHFSL